MEIVIWLITAPCRQIRMGRGVLLNVINCYVVAYARVVQTHNGSDGCTPVQEKSVYSVPWNKD